MTATTDDLRIQQITELISPEQLVKDIGVSEQGGLTVAQARQTIHRILHDEDDRLLYVAHAQFMIKNLPWNMLICYSRLRNLFNQLY